MKMNGKIAYGGRSYMEKNAYIALFFERISQIRRLDASLSVGLSVWQVVGECYPRK